MRQDEEQMRSDTLMKYFVELRNSIEKTGEDRTRANVILPKFSSDDMSKLGPRPPGAKGFFFGDRAGGSGWMVEVEPGVTEPFYVDLPPETVRVWVTLDGAPEEFGSDPIALCERYLAKLEKIMSDAEGEFGTSPPTTRRRGMGRGARDA